MLLTAYSELFRRLRLRPALAAELVIASLFANVLALASPLFVTQVLNRYVSYGVDATLATLTSGVLIAVALEFGFRHVRARLAGTIGAEPDRQLAVGAFGIMTAARTAALSRIPSGERRETLRGLDLVEQAHGAPNVAAVLDVPFALIFVFALGLMSPTLAGIVFAFILIVGFYSAFMQRGLRDSSKRMTEISAAGNTLVGTASTASDTVRAFGAAPLLMTAWNRYVDAVQDMRRYLGMRQGTTQTVTQSAQALMSVAIVAVGAILVVQGHLDVGAMIGANLLSARALGPIVRFAQLGETFAKADEALARLRGLARLELEPDEGSALRHYSGRIELRDVAFAFSGSSSPLFESLNLSLAPGSVLVVTGRNGAGKTTLARMLVGLVDPTRGQVFADGVDLRQMAPGWWRRQVCYLPQEPSFIDATIRENLLAANPELDEEGIQRVVRAAGLGTFIDESAKGLDTPITNNGFTLSVGHRRRLALARALTGDGQLVVFDEPTEGLDAEGRNAVYAALLDLARRGRTIVAISHDPTIMRGARLVLDLNAKPVPRLVTVAPTAEAVP
ncbi:MAG: peptidase domain-containing ABC transporter [Alphaproteobacteria bacterium]